MDQVSTTDLMSLLIDQRASIDLQFQFWLTITFAVLAAAFAAGHRWLAALLYAMASIHLALRWSYDGAVGVRWTEELVRRGIDIGIPWPAVYMRSALMLVGTIGTLYVLLVGLHPENRDQA
jgi:hypothetical protein